MKIEFPKDSFFYDGMGDAVKVLPNKNVHSALTIADYTALELSHTTRLYIEKDKLTDDFIAIENSYEINHSKKDKFQINYKFWYHPELDFYLSIKNTLGPRYHYETDEQEPSENLVRILSAYHKYENVQSVQKYLNENIIDDVKNDNKIDIIVQSQMGFDFIEHSLKPTEIDVDAMYNDNFRPVYDHIVDKLNNSGKGIVLLHGTAGTGKTSLIRHLTTVVNEKFVFVPINMIAHISSPSFIGDLIENKGGVLVIEDCENFIQDRTISENSIVSSLLQVTDGILSDILGLKVICTFNTDLTRVDPALMREGRLIAEYKFEELSSEKADKLAGHHVEGPRTLGNIFNDLTFIQSKVQEKTIGFGN